MIELATNDVWAWIVERARRYDHFRLAVSYVGSEAASMFPLAFGDLVIVDASDQALKNGSTNPDPLGEWLESGAQVRSLGQITFG